MNGEEKTKKAELITLLGKMEVEAEKLKLSIMKGDVEALDLKEDNVTGCLACSSCILIS